ncbi:MAG: 4-vinyl reductase [Anaerolineales bacterium]|nr:4-vinyl reductase [Anaerolineales bacterium]
MPEFSAKILSHFIEIITAEIGINNLATVLSKAGLPATWADAATARTTSPAGAAKTFAGLQQAMRTYYGRGARGTLQRIGSNLWERLLKNASFSQKTQAKLIRGMPQSMRRKAALDLLARLLSYRSGDVTVHTLDLDLLLIDHNSPGAKGQHDDEPICYVTQGLIREALYWATRKEPNIEESCCQAMGAETCEFKIVFGESK